MHSSRLAAAVAAAAAITGSCRSTPPAAIDPELSACVPANAVLVAGVDLDRLRVSALYPKIAPTASLVLEPLHYAARLLIAWDGRQFVFIARGNFREAPPGATLLSPNLAVSGTPEAVRAAIVQRKTGSGTPDVLTHAPHLDAGTPIWAAIRGGVSLPLTGNAANLNRLLRLIDYATLTAKLDPRIELDLTGVSRTADEAQQFEETVRAMFSLAGAASPHLDPVLRTVAVRREGATVHATLSAEPETAAKLIDSLVR